MLAASARREGLLIRTDPARALEEMRAFGVEPAVSFPGTNRPWAGVHLRCGRPVAPSLANARRNGGVCRPCAAVDRGAVRKLGLAAAAAADMRALGWEPLEEYPGADAPWLAKHLRCGDERTTTLNHVRTKGSCFVCSRAERGMRTWDAPGATAVFEAAGLEPLEQYPGSSSAPWRSRHLACGSVVSPRLGNLVAGQGPCNACAQVAAHRAMMMPEHEAIEVLREAGLEAIAPFPGVDRPWPARHLACGRETAPTLSNLKRGQGGCRSCGFERRSERLRMSESDAREVMLARGLDPVEPYPGSGRPWASRHTCGRLVRPALSNVRAGKGICRYCFSSFDYEGPAEVYLVADSRALKVGCSTSRGERVATHRRFGWRLQWRIDGVSGDDAYAIEQGVIAWWRDEIGVPQVYQLADMPQGGYTETAPWGAVSAASTLEWALAFASAAGLSARVAEIPVGVDVQPPSPARPFGPRKAATRDPGHPTLF